MRAGENALSIDEVYKLLFSIEDSYASAIISLCIATGMRRHDLACLKRENYDRVNMTITFYEKKKRINRTIPIPSITAVNFINSHLDNARESVWLFPSPKQTGKYKDAHVSDRHIYDIFNESLDNVGLERRTLHSLRATCLQLAFLNGWNLIDGCNLIGNKLATSQFHYDVQNHGNMKDLAKNNPIF